METKKNSLESSVLGVWQDAIEEGDSRMDGRTKQYKSHRSKLEAARLRRGERNLNKEEVELNEKPAEYLEIEFKDKTTASKAYDYINNKIEPGGSQPWNDFNQEGNSIQFEKMRDADSLMKELKKKFKFTVYEREEVSIEEIEELYVELSDEEFDAILEEADEELLDNLEIFFTEDIKAISEKPGLLKKIGGAIAKRIPGTSAHRKKTIAKAASREKQRGAKAAKIKAKKKEKSDYKKAKAYLKTKKKASVFGDENDPVQEGAEGGTGDKKEYQKFFQKAMKKFGVTEPDQLKGDKRKEFYDYIDKNWKADNEKAEGAMSQVREFKIQSMKAALAKVWGMEEGNNPFAEHKGTEPHKHPHHDQDREEEEEEHKKKVKTETGKKPATIDLKPKIDD